jgi:hypothetical protein
MFAVTKKKQREAQFFLHHLETVSRAASSDPEAFAFYLSAFMAAARSVFFVLFKEQAHERTKDPMHETTKEFEKRQKKAWNTYTAWATQWQATRTADENHLWDLVRSQRNAEIHDTGGSRQSKVQWKLIAIPSAPGREGTVHMGRSVGIDPPMTAHLTWYFQDARGALEVLAACQAYLVLLDAFLQDYIVAHP